MIRLIHLRGAPFLDEQGAGNLQDEVADEEYTGSRSRTQPRCQTRAGRSDISAWPSDDVDAIDIGDDIAQEQDRQQSDVCLASGSVDRRDGRGRSRHGQAHGGPGGDVTSTQVETRYGRGPKRGGLCAHRDQPIARQLDSNMRSTSRQTDGWGFCHDRRRPRSPVGL